jgi:cyclase
MTERKTVLENDHFRLRRLTDGVFAAIGTVEGGAMSNAGIVDLGDETVVFDAFLTRAAAAELRAAAEELTGRAPRYLVNSHGHGDHVWGNAVFRPVASILASGGTAAMMTAEERASIDPAGLAAAIERLEQALAEEADEAVRLDIEGNLYPRKRLLEELPLDLAPPTIVFEGAMEIRGSRRTVRLVTAERAHTAGDVYLVCPADRIAFLGDLGFFGDSPPYIAPEGSAAGWSSILRDFESLDVGRFVPGHGGVGGVPELVAQRGFLDAVIGAARQVAGGGTVDDVVDRMRETEYARWEKTTLYRASLESALRQVGGGTRPPGEADAG